MLYYYTYYFFIKKKKSIINNQIIKNNYYIAVFLHSIEYCLMLRYSVSTIIFKLNIIL